MIGSNTSTYQIIGTSDSYNIIVLTNQIITSACPPFSPSPRTYINIYKLAYTDRHALFTTYPQIGSRYIFPIAFSFTYHTIVAAFAHHTRFCLLIYCWRLHGKLIHPLIAFDISVTNGLFPGSSKVLVNTSGTEANRNGDKYVAIPNFPPTGIGKKNKYMEKRIKSTSRDVTNYTHCHTYVV